MSKVKDPMDRQLISVNGITIYADEFAWDECHKIYIVTDQESRDQLEGYGYEFFPINELEDAWQASCFLRFISDASLSCDYVSQCHESYVEIVTP